MFQGDHGPVAYREIDVIPLSAVPLAIPTTDELETKMAEEVTEANADEEFEKLRQELEAEEDG